jgi:Peptidase family M48
MRMHKILPTMILALGAMPLAITAQQQAAAPPERATVAQVVDKIVAQEHAEMNAIRKYSPLVETYIQTVRPDKELGAVPNGDKYFLGRAELDKGVQLEPLVKGDGGNGSSVGAVKQKFFASLGNMFSGEFLPRGFLQMIYLDEEGFDQQHYKFSYAGREFLGDVRCLIFDVDPLANTGKGRFSGRIWVEDQDFHIVRFNGSYGGSSRGSFYFNFDSWRENSGKNEWLPAYIYSEQGNVEYGVAKHSAFRPFKSQTRLWGYDLNREQEAQTLSSVEVEGPKVKDQTEAGNGYSPLQAKRAWGRLAEDNVAAKMQRTGLMAPYGDVDKVLETVVNNLEVTNELEIQPEVRCRVLMTSTLESFTMGHTIVLSRGLIDVLPDETSLAAVLAHELGHVMLGHRMDTEFAFFNRVRFDEKDTFHHFGFARNADEEEAANQKGIELLKKSPYQDKSGTAEAFFAALQKREKEVPNLISPHLGDRVPKHWTSASGTSDQQAVKTANVIVALPLGARIKVEPWDDRLVMLKAQPEGAVAEYEKMPFEVAPFLVYLTRQNGNAMLHDAGTMATRTDSDPAPAIAKP